MTTPALAHDDDWAKGRVYVWPETGKEYLSVTNAIKSLSKGEALPKWAAREAAAGAARLLEDAASKNINPMKNKAWLASIDPYWANIQEAQQLGLPAPGYADGYEPSWPDSFVRAAKAAPYQQRDDAADLGDLIHKRIEATILHQELPECPKELRGHMRQFEAFEREFEPQYQFSEMTVFNDRFGYAGTGDAGFYSTRLNLKIPGPAGPKLIVVDFKTGKNVYNEAALQLNAIMEGEWAGMDDGRTKHPMPQAAAGAVLHLRPRSWHLYLVKRDPNLFSFFAQAVDLKPWFALTKEAILKDVTPKKEQTQ